MTTETTDLLRGELERLFELDEMAALSSELMGYDADALGLDVADGDSSGKGAWARALVDKAASDTALEALADAIHFFGKHSPDAAKVFAISLGKEPEPGSKIGEFTVRKKLAEGGLGKVYLAERGEGDERVRVAIKVIRTSLAQDRSAVARYLTSQRAYQRANLEGIGAIFGCGKLEDGRPWVATQFIEGQTLAARISRVGPMHFNEARPIFVGLLDALERLHKKGLMHVDVKTANVFTTRPVQKDGSRGEPTGILIDGGAYRLLAGGASRPDAIGALRVFGNAHAISPEMARGADVDASSDLYAVGIAFYEALAGRLPFDGSSAFEVIAMHLKTKPEAPSAHAPKGWVPPELDALVLRSLAKDPADRFQTAAEFREAIEAHAKSKEKKVDLDNKAFDKAIKALAKKPASAAAAASVEEIAAPAGAWAKAIDAFRDAAGKAKKDSNKTRILCRIARIQEIELSDRDAAKKTFEEIREIDADNRVAQNGLEELCRHKGDHEGLSELLLEKVERVESTEERAGVLRELGELYDVHLSDPENALVAWTQALADEPRDKRTQRAVERLAGNNLDSWNEVLGSLNEAAQEPEDESDAVVLYNLMGRWYASEVKRPDYALPCFEHALQLDPSNDKAYDGTADLYRKAQSWQELGQLLLTRADASTNPAAARDYRAEAADIVLRKLSDQDTAMGMFQDVLKDDPNHPMALDALASVHESRQEWKELAELLHGRIGSAQGTSKVSLHLRLANVYEDRLSEFDKASVQFDAALAIDDQNVDALKGLESVYARTDNYQKLLDTLNKQLEVVATPRQKIGLLEHVGAIQEEEFVNLEAATTAYEKVIKINPKHEASLSALARLYRSQDKYDELVEVLEKHASASVDQDRKIALTLRAAKTLMTDVGSLERAIEVCDRVLELDPKNVEALGLSARLKAQTGDASAAVAAVDQLAAHASDDAGRARHYIEAGKLLEDAGDNDGAINRYKRALEAEEDNSRAAQALRRLYGARGDARGAADLLQRELERTDSDMRKAKLNAELGRLYAERLNDNGRAREAYETALELDSNSVEAARGLGDMAFAAGKPNEAARLYEPLLARTGDMEPEVAKEICLRTGDAYRDAEEWGKAQRAYINAKAFAPKDRAILEKIADVTFEAGEADEAAEFYGQLLSQFGDEITGSERGRILYRRGDSLRRTGEFKEAEKLLKEASENLEAPEVLGALALVYKDQGKFDQFITMNRHRMESLADEQRFAVLVDIGDVQLDELKDRQKAARTYVEALEIIPDDRNLLTKLMGVYSGSKNWSRLVEVILRIADLVTDSRQLSKYYITAASIAHRELKRSGEAADYYAQALDHDPTLTKAYDGIVKCLAETESWSELAAAYNTRLERLKDASPEERTVVLDALGDLYREKLEDAQKAASAYEDAQELDPDNRRRLELLVGIYETDPKRFYRKTISVHGKILRVNPYRVESYQALRRLYAKRRLEDEEWCVCQTLKALDMASPDEESLYKEHRTRHPAAAEEFFSEDIWFNHLIHHDQDPMLTGIFAELVPAAAKAGQQSAAKYKIEGVSPCAADDEAAMVETLNYVASVTQIGLPPVYYRKKDQGGLSLMLLDAPAIGVGKGALAGGPPQALAFVASRHLAYFRSGMLMRQLVPSGRGLRAWLLASIRLVTPAFPVPPKMTSRVEVCSAALAEHIDRTGQDRIKALVRKLLSAAPELDMKKWIAAVDLTADRVGFVMANDLALAAAVIKASPEDTMAQKERLKELYLYSASPAYMQLREKIGVAIE